MAAAAGCSPHGDARKEELGEKLAEGQQCLSIWQSLTKLQPQRILDPFTHSIYFFAL
jgi:hypothetical protein